MAHDVWSAWLDLELDRGSVQMLVEEDLIYIQVETPYKRTVTPMYPHEAKALIKRIEWATEVATENARKMK